MWKAPYRPDERTTREAWAGKSRFNARANAGLMRTRRGLLPEGAAIELLALAIALAALVTVALVTPSHGASLGYCLREWTPNVVSVGPCDQTQAQFDAGYAASPRKPLLGQPVYVGRPDGPDSERPKRKKRKRS